MVKGSNDMQLMNMTEATIYTGLHRATLWRIIRENNIKTHPDDRDKRAVCVLKKDIERFRSSRTSRRVLKEAS